MHKAFLLVASIFGFLAVAFGAFGAHALRQRLSPDMLNVFEIGVRYQMYHVFALMAVAAALTQFGPGGARAGASAGALRLLTIGGWSFVAGVLIFSGSLYALALTGTGMFGAITPIGGLGLLVGWACLAFFAASL
jgi:uncharacterized membrane protein YgdD (TMEM256/DUF423 family)